MAPDATVIAVALKFGTIILVRLAFFCFAVSVVFLLCVASTFAFVSVLRWVSPPSFTFPFSMSVAFALLATFAFVGCESLSSVCKVVLSRGSEDTSRSM